VNTDGTTVCWGPSPFAAEPPRDLKQIAVGDGTACGLTSGGEIRCWGKSPGWIPRGPFLSLSAGKIVCGLRRNGQIVCFGGTMVNGEAP
jgi:hypothetical protein